MAVSTSVLVTSAIAAAAAGATGATMQYRQSKANAETNESAALANAKAAENEARSTQLQSEENARRQQVERRRALSSMRAKYGMSGAALDSGSPLAQMAQSAADLSLQANDTMVAGHARSTSLLSQADASRTQAWQAKKSRMTGWQLAASIIGSVGSAGMTAGGAFMGSGGSGSSGGSAGGN